MRPATHPFLLHYNANKLAPSIDIQFIPYLHLHNLPHQPIDITQQPPNLPEGHAQVVIDHVLHVMDDFLAVTVPSARFFSNFQERLFGWP